MALLDTSIATNVATVTLGAAEVSVLISPNATGIPITEYERPDRTTPIALAFVQLGSITGLTAAATLTVNIRNGTANNSPVIGSAVRLLATAETSTDISLWTVVPAGVQNVWFGASVSAGAGTVQGAVTTPIVCGLIYLN